MSIELDSEGLIAKVEDDLKYLSPNGLRVYIVKMHTLGRIVNENNSNPIIENFESLVMMSDKLSTGKRLNQDEMGLLVSIIKKCIISSNRKIM